MSTPATVITSTAANETFKVYTTSQMSPQGVVTQELHFDQGFGQDQVVVDSPSSILVGSIGMLDTQTQPYIVKLGAGIKPSDVQLVRLSDQPSGIRNGGLVESFTVERWELRIRNSYDRILFSDMQRSSGTEHDALRALTRIEFADGTVWTPQDVNAALQAPSNAMYEVYGTGGNDLLTGDASAHRILADDGDDTLASGSGDDVLNGGWGRNVYRFDGASGHDTIAGPADYNYNNAPVGSTIEFGPSIRAADVKLSWIGEDMLVNLANGASIRLAGVGSLSGGNLNLSGFTFADGTSWAKADLSQHFDNTPTSGKDVMRAIAGGVVFSGGAGDDVLTAYGGQGTLLGGEGRDTLTGDHITAEGGAGNDVITAQTGVFKYRPGFGQDVLSAQWADAGTVIQLLDGIGPQDVSLYRAQGGLVINLNASGDSLRLSGAYVEDLSAAQARIEFANGQSIALKDIVAGPLGPVVSLSMPPKTVNGTDGQDTIMGSNADETFIDSAGNDIYETNGLGGRDIISLNEGHANDHDLVRVHGVNPGDVSVVSGYASTGYMSTIVRFGNLSELALGSFAGDEPEVADERLTLAFDDGTTWNINQIYAKQALGSSGDDLIFSTSMADRYVFGVGSGADRINTSFGWASVPGFTSNPLNPSHADRVLLTTKDVTFAYARTESFGGKFPPPTLSGIRISVNGTSDQLEVFNGTDSSPGDFLNSTLPVVEFLDGSTLTGQQIKALIDNPPVARPLVITANQVITGTFRDDTLFGGSGNDLIEAGQGNDRIDTQNGGNDTLVAWAGDGADTLVGQIATLRLKGVQRGQILVSDEGFKVVQLGRTVYSLAASAAQVQGIELDDGTVLTVDEARQPVKQGTLFDDRIVGTNFADKIDGLQGSDTIDGGLGNDTITGGTLPSQLTGGGGNDVLISKGVDTLLGGAGADTFKFATVPHGATIADLQWDLSGDTIVIDRALTDFKLSLDNSDYNSALLLNADGAPGHPDLRIEYFATQNANGGAVQLANLKIQFSDNQVLSGQALYDKVLASTSGDDVINGSVGGDVISGGAGNDRLYGLGGNDTLTGGLGNDDIDTGNGADIVRYARGDGYDTIRGDSLDTVQVADGISASDVVFIGDSGSDKALHMVLKDGSGGFRLSSDYNWFLPTLAFASGSSLDGAALQNMIQWHSTYSGDDTLYAVSGEGSSVYGEGGNDLIIGNVGNDILDGGQGNDTLQGNGGSDTYTFGLGDGQDLVHADAQDRIVFKEGIGKGDITVGRLGETGADKVVLSLRQNSALTGDTITLDKAGTWDGMQLRFADGSSMSGADIMALARTSQNLVLTGSARNEALLGGGGNDTLNGMAGTDTLDGGAGADTYLFARGDGHDLIHADTFDSIVFGQGISKSDIAVGRLGASGSPTWIELSLKQGGQPTSDSITLDSADNWAGLKLQFADGTSMSGTDIMAQARQTTNLQLTGTTGKDKLQGLDGNDTLSGLAGVDTLAGGKGDDTLIGGKGNDTYLFNAGDGHDTLIDQDGTWFNSDQLRISGATSKQLWLSRSGNSLDIAVIGTHDHVTIQDWFASASNRVEKIVASDGKTLNLSKVSSLVSAMAAFSPPADGVTTMPTSLTKAVTGSWY